MAGILDAVSFWHWLALGLLLMLVEVLAPGVLFLWLGVAGLAVGFALLALPGMAWELQLVLFAAFSVAATILGRRFVAARQASTDHPTLNRRGAALVGNRYVLDEATAGGRGRVRVGDAAWACAVTPPGTDLDAGARVAVVGVDGATLVVRAEDGTG